METPLVHIYYTGGTIGMIKDSEDKWVLDPEFSTKLRTKYLLNIRVPQWDIYVRERTLDSSNMTPQDWESIAAYIKKKEEDNPGKYSGYVILHGTDTMAYTTSALTFMIENPPKPIIFTGSQVPMSEERNDAINNVVDSLRLAGPDQHPPLPPHVYLLFFRKLMLGCRAVKIDTKEWDAFDTPNLPSVATMVNEEIMFNEQYMTGLQKMKTTGELTIREFTETEVGVLRLFPGLSKSIAENFFFAGELKGAIIHAYGAGNGPGSLEDVFKEAAGKKVVVACTQCLKGSVSFDYATGLGRYGVISGHDMTLEAATTKLFWLFSKYPGDPVKIKEEMQRNTRGELTEPTA
jgi:L-asparaginase